MQRLMKFVQDNVPNKEMQKVIDALYELLNPKKSNDQQKTNMSQTLDNTVSFNEIVIDKRILKSI